MLINISPPKESLKNIIINIVINNKDLTVDKIRQILKKNYQKSVTYQGVNKVLNLLKDEKVILKSKKLWYFNPKWVNSIANTFFYYDQELKQDNINKEIKTLVFPNVGKTWEFFLKQLKNNKFNLSKDKSVLIHVKNFAYFGRNKEELSFIKKFAQDNECIFIVEKSNLINKYIAKYLRSINIKVLIGVPHSTPHSTIVFGDTVIFMYYTKEDLVDYHNKIYSKIKNLSSLKAINIFTNLRDDNRFQVTVVFNHDAEIANLTRKHILKFAKDYKK